MRRSENVVAEVDPADPDLPPLEAVRTMAVAIRGALGRHPWAAELWLRALPGPERTRLMDDLLRLLDGSGLSLDLAHHGFHAVTNHVVGYTLQEVGMTRGRDETVATAEEFLAGSPLTRIRTWSPTSVNISTGRRRAASSSCST